MKIHFLDDAPCRRTIITDFSDENKKYAFILRVKQSKNSRALLGPEDEHNKLLRNIVKYLPVDKE